ncbi:MAG: hypothetical protein HQL28_06450 [Candidatus Omnitrophica bacterium]|nr:hypothetical protein [Candidatus Omnitrophota bacterium]
MMDTISGDRFFRSCLSGSARSVRLSRSYEDTHKRIVWATGSDIVGPLIFLYVAWVLEEARKRDIKRVYFLARDGEVMLKTAKLINEYWRHDIELKYLYGSRGAWLPLALGEIGDFEFHWMTWGYLSTVSLEELCARLFIKYPILEKYFDKYGLTANGSGRNLSLSEVRLLRNCLQDKEVQDIISDNADARRRDALAYFEQEGLFQETPYAVVDTGWGASSQYALSGILDKAGKYPGRGVTGFYMGASEAKQIYKNDKVISFLFDWTKEPRDYRLSNYLFYEIFTAARHGRTIGYDGSGGEVVPVLDNTSNEMALAWGLNVQEESVLAYSTVFSGHLTPEVIDFKAARTILRKLLCMFMESPGREEADVYGKYAIGGEITERDFNSFAPAISHAEFWKIALGKERFKGFWPTGTLVRSNMPVIKFMWDIVQRFNLLYYLRKYIFKY